MATIRSSTECSWVDHSITCPLRFGSTYDRILYAATRDSADGLIASVCPSWCRDRNDSQEIVAVYNSEPRAMQLTGTRDGIAIPSEKIESGIRSLTMTDFHQWTLANQSWPAGTWRYKSAIAFLKNKLWAQASLTADGLSIQLPTDLPSRIEDGCQHGPGAPSLGKVVDGSRLEIDGTWPPRASDGRSIPSLPYEQRRRSKVYADLFNGDDATRLPDQLLYGWTDFGLTLLLGTLRWRNAARLL